METTEMNEMVHLASIICGKPQDVEGFFGGGSGEHKKCRLMIS
jgi:hypothetical protein